MSINYQKIAKVEFLCRQNAVGFDLCFCESDGTYYYSINSPAPEEQWMGKNVSFDPATENVIEWLISILSDEAREELIIRGEI